MANVIWPDTLQIGTADYALEWNTQITYGRDGSVQTFALPGARWTATLTFEAQTDSPARARIEAFITNWRGGANRLQMPFLWRPVPNGSLRGTPSLAQSASSGATTLELQNCNGTLLAGDFIGVLGQNMMVMQDASPAGGGFMTVSINPPLRTAANVGTSVEWNRPAILWIPRSRVAGPFPYRQGRVRPGFSIELVEAY